MDAGSREKSDRFLGADAPGSRLVARGGSRGLGILSSSDPDEQSEQEEAVARRSRLFGSGANPVPRPEQPSESAEEHPNYDDPPGQPWPPDDGHDRGYN